MVKLLEHVDLLRDMSEPTEMDRKDVSRLLTAAAGIAVAATGVAIAAAPASNAAGRCLEAALYHSGAVHVFVDGMDEVMPVYTDKALRLLDLLLKETKAARVWVASRPEADASLRRLLRCAPVSLLPLSRAQQLDYLRSRWASAASPDVIERLAEKMVDIFAAISSSEVQSPALQMNDQLGRLTLLGLPLNLEMAAEVFADDVTTALETNSKGRVSQLDMFKRFIENKRERKKDIYEPRPSMREITYVSKLEDKIFFPLHQNYAMLVWTAATLPSLQQKFQKSIKKYEKVVNQEKSGILWKMEDGRPQFLHYIFVEYFVANWLFEHRNESQETKHCLIQAYRQRPRGKVAFFLDLMLAKKRPFHQAIIENNRDVLDAPLPQRIKADRGGRSVLHLAAAYGRTDAVTNLLDAGYKVSQHDSLLKWTALQYALNEDTAEKLLERGANSNDLLSFDIDIYYVAQSDLVGVMRLLLNANPAIIKSFKISYKLKNHTSNELVEKSFILSTLQIAARAGSMRVARLLLDNEAEVNGCGEGGRTPLHEATEGRHMDMVQLLLSYGADVNIKDINGRSPIHYAALNDDKGILEKLSERKYRAEINVTDKWKYTPLHMASYKGHTESVEFLLDKGADSSLKSVEELMPIHLAAANGHKLATEILLHRGDNIHCQGYNNATPLHYASENGHTNVVQMLLSRCADVSKRTKCARTPVHVAAFNGHKQVLEMLLQKPTTKKKRRSQLPREEVNTTDKKHCTPLHMASYNGHREVVEFLLDQGADAFIKTVDGHLPIHLAAANGHELATEVFLLRGADIHCRGQNHFTPLHYASEKGHASVVRLLLSCKADVNKTALENATSLHLATCYGHLEVVEILLGAGAHVNACNAEGRSALHFGCLKGHVEIVRQLLARDADALQTDNKGHDPFHYADSKRHLDIMELLLTEILRRASPSS